MLCGLWSAQHVTLSWVHYQCGFVCPPILKLREKVRNKSISTGNGKLSLFNKKFGVSIIREGKRFYLHDFDGLLVYQHTCLRWRAIYAMWRKRVVSFYSPCNSSSLTLFMIKKIEAETWVIKWLFTKMLGLTFENHGVG